MSLVTSALTLVRWLGPWETTGVPSTVDRRTHELSAGVRAYVYAASARQVEGVWVLAPGLHFLGPDDPRLDRFCRILAASGTVVVAPFLRDHIGLRVSARSTDDLAEAFALGESIAAERRLPRPALFSISFGSQPAIELAARDSHRDRVGALVLFGGFADFDASVRFCITGRAARGQDALAMTHDPLNAPVVWLHLLDHLDLDCDRERVATAWRAMVHRTWGKMELKAKGARDPIAHELARDLDPRDRDAFLLGCGLADGAEIHLDLALSRTKDHYAFTDPRPHLARIRAPIAVVHGRDDDVIPWFEAEKLRDALPAGVPSRVLITGLYGHTGAGDHGWSVSPKTLARELATMTGVIRTLAEAPRGRFTKG